MSFRQMTPAGAVRFPLAACLCITLAACDSKNGPMAPSPPPGGPTAVSIAISGQTILEQPGDTGRLRAMVTYSDNTTRDVTADAIWSASEGAVAITQQAEITALRYGIVYVTARYDTISTVAAVRVAPAGAFLVHGVVSTAMGVPLRGARVEVSSGCGTMSIETDDRGVYWLPFEGEAVMRVDMQEFISQTVPVTLQADGLLNLTLEFIDTPGSLSGDYRLTVTASPSCTLPAEVRERGYDALITEIHSDLYVDLSGATLVAWGGRTGFTGTRDGATVTFIVRNTFDDGYNFVERIADGRDLYYSGTARGDVIDGRILALFAGAMDTCTADDHRFELVPVTGSGPVAR